MASSDDRAEQETEPLPAPTKLGVSITIVPHLQVSSSPVCAKDEDGELVSSSRSRRRMMLFASAVSLMLVAAVTCVMLLVGDLPPPKDVTTAHVHFSDRSVARIAEILSFKARRIQEVDNILDEDEGVEGDSPFAIDAVIDTVDVTKFRDQVKSGGQVRIDLTTCTDGAEDGCENVLPLVSGMADSIDEPVLGEFTVAGTLDERSSRRLRSLAEIPDDEIREGVHFEVNCDMEDPEAVDSDGCDVELFNLVIQTDNNTSAPERRTCGRRRRRRRRREDRRRRRNIFRARRLQEINASSAMNMPVVLTNQSVGTESGNRLLNALQSCPWSCPMWMMGDGQCNWQCNSPECNYDDTDCADYIIDIERTLVGKATLGNLFLYKKANGKKKFVKKFHTLEPSFESSLEGSGARIPDGSYAAVHPHFSQRLGYSTIWLQNTWPRTEILIHRGNTVQHTAGCILVGRRNYWADELQLAAGSSEPALSYLLDAVKFSTVSVRIRGDPIPYSAPRYNEPPELSDCEKNGGYCLHDYDWLPLPKYLPPVCFPGTASVRLASGFKKTVAQLQFGDLIETFSPSGQLQYERFLMDFHGLNDVTAEFLRLHIGISDALEVTPNHLVFESGMHAVRAARLRPGDTVLVVGPRGELVPKNITKIEKVLRMGVYSPLTFSGRLVVEGVAVSSYGMLWPEPILQELEASHAGRWLVKYAHDLMHLGTTPLRWSQYVSVLLRGALGVELVKPTGMEVHWFAMSAKEIFEKLVMLPLFPTLRVDLQSFSGCSDLVQC